MRANRFAFNLAVGYIRGGFTQPRLSGVKLTAPEGGGWRNVSPRALVCVAFFFNGANAY